MDEAIREKHARFKAYSALKKGRMTAEDKGAKTAYIDTKHVAKHAVWLAKSEAEKEVFAAIFPDGDGVFHIAKQMNCTNQDVVSDNCVHNDVGQLALTPAQSMHLTILTCYIKACESEITNEICIFRLNGVYSDQNTHHSWDAESCWWGRSWASETTDRGCFLLQCHYVRLGEELHSEPL